MATRNWWAYRIAAEYSISPVEVKTWAIDDVMEALAAISLVEKDRKKKEQKAKK